MAVRYVTFAPFADLASSNVGFRMGLLVFLALGVGFWAGTRTERARTTWGDHAAYRNKMRALRWVRFTHWGWALAGWAALALVAAAMLRHPG